MQNAAVASVIPSQSHTNHTPHQSQALFSRAISTCRSAVSSHESPSRNIKPLKSQKSKFPHCLTQTKLTNMMAVRAKPESEMEVRFETKPKPAAAYSSTDESEMDQESGGSSEEMESPRSVGRWRRRRTKRLDGYVHNQVLKIREEDSHLGETSSLGSKDKVVTHRIDFMLYSRPVLPSSPLKNTVTAL